MTVARPQAAGGAHACSHADGRERAASDVQRQREAPQAVSSPGRQQSGRVPFDQHHLGPQVPAGLRGGVLLRMVHRFRHSKAVQTQGKAVQRSEKQCTHKEM